MRPAGVGHKKGHPSDEPCKGWQTASLAAAARELFWWGEGDHTPSPKQGAAGFNSRRPDGGCPRLAKASWTPHRGLQWGEGDHRHHLPTPHRGNVFPNISSFTCVGAVVGAWVVGPSRGELGASGGIPRVKELAGLDSDGWRVPGQVHVHTSSEET